MRDLQQSKMRARAEAMTPAERRERSWELVAELREADSVRRARAQKRANLAAPVASVAVSVGMVAWACQTFLA